MGLAHVNAFEGHEYFSKTEYSILTTHRRKFRTTYA